MTDPQRPIDEDDLQGFVDGRLSEARRAAVDAYLAGNPEARERVTADRSNRNDLRLQLAQKLIEPVPARLRIAAIRAGRRERRSWLAPRAIAAAITIFVVGAGSGWLAGRIPPGAAPDTTTVVAQDASAAYRTFVVEIAHPVEVGAANERHLLQWLTKRLGRPLVAPDLAAFGYRLMGGRLLPGGTGAAAQLMYDDASGKRLTVYVQAATGTETAFRFRRDGDAATFAWIDQGFGFAVTGPGDRATLLPIAEAVYHGLEPPMPARLR